MVSLIPFRRRGEVTTRDFSDPFDLMDSFFRPLAMRSQGTTPHVDIHEQKDAYVVKADLPGMRAEDISVDIDQGTLTISGTYASSKEEKDQSDVLVYSERRTGSFSRSFTLPGISRDHCDATMKDGVLTITLRKHASAKEKVIAVKQG